MRIRPLLDPVIPVEEFKFEADRAHSHVIELNFSHASPISFPDVVVESVSDFDTPGYAEDAQIQISARFFMALACSDSAMTNR
jgi:hypothetical protein